MRVTVAPTESGSVTVTLDQAAAGNVLGAIDTIFETKEGLQGAIGALRVGLIMVTGQTPTSFDSYGEEGV